MQLYNLLIQLTGKARLDFQDRLLNIAGAYVNDGQRAVARKEPGGAYMVPVWSYTLAVPVRVWNEVLALAYASSDTVFSAQVGTYGPGDPGPKEVAAPTGDVVGLHAPPKQDMLDGWYSAEEADALPRTQLEGIARAARQPIDGQPTQGTAAELPSLANIVGERLRTRARIYSDAAWAVDSAASKLRKAKAGYRSTALLGDAPWDVEAIEAELQTAITAGSALVA